MRPRYECCDMSNEPGGFDSACDRIIGAAESLLNASDGPQISLLHLRAGDRHRLCFAGPHALLDMDGLQLLVAEMDRLSVATPSPARATLAPDHEIIDPFSGIGLVERLKWVAEGVRNLAPDAPVQEASLLDALPNRPAQSRRPRFLRRSWSGADFLRVRQNARRIHRDGPALYSRYFAGCVIRANYRVHAEHGRKLPYYGTMFPMKFPGLQRRPIQGNTLVSAPMCILPDQIDDRKTVAQEVDRQFNDYIEQKQYYGSWALLWLPAQLRSWQYRLFMGRYVNRQPFATGFSFFGPIDPPVTHLLGAEVTNMHGSGLISAPPGWNPVFSRWGDQINLLLFWPDGSYPPDVVERYADLIVEESLAE